VFPPPPGVWSASELHADAKEAKRLFVAERLAALTTERTTYLNAHAEYAQTVHGLLTATKDLRQITGSALEDRARLDLARKLAVPPISLDDLDTLTDSVFGNWVGQTTNRGMRPTGESFDQAARIIAERIDRDRAPWLATHRAPTTAERTTFIEWAAAGPAAGRITTLRRNEASARQEQATRAAANAASYTPVKPPGTLTDPIKQLPPASYASASRKLNGTNMDVPIRLKTGHPTGLLFLAVECKVSNSSLNSRKRLIEVGRKREIWDSSGQLYQFRTAAILSGVFSVERLLEAQEGGVLLFWEHRLTDLTAYLRA
jgi:XamI restriction endonuclease